MSRAATTFLPPATKPSPSNRRRGVPPGSADEPPTLSLDMLPRVEAELFRHPIVLDNRYTRWFRKGEATQEDLRRFAVQFSVFSNQFLVAQLQKMINAGSLGAMRSAKEIL